MQETHSRWVDSNHELSQESESWVIAMMIVRVVGVSGLPREQPKATIQGNGSENVKTSVGNEWMRYWDPGWLSRALVSPRVVQAKPLWVTGKSLGL